MISTIERLAEVAVQELQKQGFMANWYTLLDGTIQVSWVEGHTKRWVNLRGKESE